MLSPEHPLVDGRTSSAPYVRAVRGERPERTPVWFLTPTGTADPLSPEQVAETTLEHARRTGGDAVALGIDPFVPVMLAGVDVRFEAGRGALVDQPIRTGSDVLRLRPIDPAVLAPIADAVRLVVAELGSTPLVAVGSAPFALASHLVEGRSTTDPIRARAMMYRDPHAWASLLNWCADVTGALLRAQIEAGASVAQLHEPGLGALSRRDYQRRVAPHAKRAIDALRGLDAPRVHSGEGAGEVLDLLAGVGANAVGVDRRLPLDVASERLGGGVPVQGNLDPALLFAPVRTLRAHIDDVIDRGRDAPAHIVTLGGALPDEADPDVLTRIAEYVHGRA